MFTFCWILLLLFIKGAEVREFNLTGKRLIYHAITDEEFILECVLPSQHHTHMYNNSFLYKSKVLWFWQQKDGEPVKIISNESTNPIQEGNALWFRPIGINASGVYICMIRYVSVSKTEIHRIINELSLLIQTGHSISCPGIHCYNHLRRSPVTWYKVTVTLLKLTDDKIVLHHIYKQDAGIYVCDYIVCDNSIQWTMRRVVRVKIIVFLCFLFTGKPLTIECKVFFGFERDFLPMITWYRDNKESKSEPLLQKPTREVTERDLNSNFICFAQNSVGNSTGVLKLKRKERALFKFILYGAIAVLVGLLVGSAFVYQHWIEIVLMYRNYLAKDETIGDSKEFDAFVSYSKQDSFESDSTFLNEEQFALEVLPEMLENKYGYKLCLLERDILPGGAYTDDIVTAIQQSRRAIIILSPGYVNGPSIFELQAAVNCALEDNMIKLILIKYKSFQEPESLPPIVKKALKILPVVTWKSSNSNSPNKQFWKYMRYHMPVKNTRGLGKNSLKFFSHRLFSMVINSRKVAWRR
uniref:Interleukin 18 receptor accessory protein n=1 Tax=Chrysemys picta bellii TaxID=8478 RepID=A0A8C3FLU2_CHRPI